MKKIFKHYTPKIIDDNGKTVPNSIAKIETIAIGGINQYIMLRGNNQANPLLLFLHGGPGLAHIPFARNFQKGLEEHFLVVNWDQRGAGLSYSNKVLEDTLNIEQFISDTYELIIKLLKRFKKEKIYLAGHSWGSYLGILMAERYPELFHAYIGISQVTDVREASRLEYLHVLKLAKEDNNQIAIKGLKNIGKPPHKDLKKFKIMRKWFNYYEGKKEINLTRIILKGILFGTEYKVFDIRKYLKGLTFSQTKITEDIYSNVFDQITTLKIPVYFCQGVNDYCTPLQLVEVYMERLSAPVKKIYIFENSAHCPHLQESEKFIKSMISIKNMHVIPTNEEILLAEIRDLLKDK